VATAQVIADEMSRIAGTPPSVTRTIARRLGEAGLLPRGGRGQPPQDLSARDCARLLLGTLRIADGIDGAAARVDQLVNEVERLKGRGKVSVGEDVHTQQMPIADAGSFVDQLATMIERFCTDEQALLTSAVSAVGLTTGPNGLWGWVELRGHGEPFSKDGAQLSRASGKIRIIFGPRDFEQRGLVREVRITSEALGEIAAAWHGEPLMDSRLPREGRRLRGNPRRRGRARPDRN
jgi:hypothetical protein